MQAWLRAFLCSILEVLGFGSCSARPPRRTGAT
jgi:hypothetical protein